MTTHSRILAWRTPRTEKPDKLQSWQSMHPEGRTELDTTEVTEHTHAVSCNGLIGFEATIQELC